MKQHLGVRWLAPAAPRPNIIVILAARWQSWAARAGVWEWDDLQKHRQKAKKSGKSR